MAWILACTICTSNDISNTADLSRWTESASGPLGAGHSLHSSRALILSSTEIVLAAERRGSLRESAPCEILFHAYYIIITFISIIPIFLLLRLGVARWFREPWQPSCRLYDGKSSIRSKGLSRLHLLHPPAALAIFLQAWVMICLESLIRDSHCWPDVQRA